MLRNFLIAALLVSGNNCFAQLIPLLADTKPASGNKIVVNAHTLTDSAPVINVVAPTTASTVVVSPGCESPVAQAYTSNTQSGNQAFRGELGMEFIVNNPNGIIVKQLGAFDDGGNGIAGLQPGGGVRVAIFNRSTHNIVPGLDITISGLADAYTGNHRMKNISAVTLLPGDYVIVAKGYNSFEKNGNVGNSSGSYPAGDDGEGAITFGNETSYGPDDPNGFNYPVFGGNYGAAPQFLAGTFAFSTIISCGSSNNATLSNLVLSEGSLTPAFASLTNNYSASVPFTATSITLTPTQADAGATIAANGVLAISGNSSGSMSLVTGSNAINVVVIAADGTTIRTYTVNVIRSEGSKCESPAAQAYISSTQTGNQSHRGELGMEFTVNKPGGIIINQLGAFDDGGDGITGLQPGGGVRVAVFDRATRTIIPGLDATISGLGDVYMGNHRMKNISPVTLPPGDYVIVAKGYHAGERNGNIGNGGGPYTGDDGGGAITFEHEASFGPDDPNGFNYPGSTVTLRDSHVFLAGTFSFITVVPCGVTCESAPAQAYTSNTHAGNQAHRGELGMEFTVNNADGINVIQLGAFDDGGDGITGLPGGPMAGVRVAIFNRTTHNIVPGLDAIISGLADAYTGNHRMKNITPVTLVPGDYVIVAKGYHAGERNGNSFGEGGPYPTGDNGGGSITFGNETLYGSDDPNGFNYPGAAVNIGDSHVFLAGTFNFTINVNCPVAPAINSIATTTDPVEQQVEESMPALAVKTKDLMVYPNPTKSQFNVQLFGVGATKLTIQIINFNGRLVEQKIISVTSKTTLLTIPFNLVNQPPGVYLVKVESSDGIKTQKIVIER